MALFCIAYEFCNLLIEIEFNPKECQIKFIKLGMLIQLLYRVKNKPCLLRHGHSSAMFFHSVSQNPLQTHTFKCGLKSEGFRDLINFFCKNFFNIYFFMDKEVKLIVIFEVFVTCVFLCS